MNRKDAALLAAIKDPSRSDVDIAAEVGCSRQMVNLIRHQYNVSRPRDLRRAGYAARKQRGLEAKLAERMQDALDRNRLCPICGAWVLRAKKLITCSPPCAKLWQSCPVRYRIAPSFRDDHRALTWIDDDDPRAVWKRRARTLDAPPRPGSVVEREMAEVERMRAANRFITDWSFADDVYLAGTGRWER